MNAYLDSLAAGAGFGLAGAPAFVALRWLLLFASSRADKREAQIDAGTRELITQLREQLALLATESKALRERVTATEQALAECQHEHQKRDIEMNELRALVAKGAE